MPTPPTTADFFSLLPVAILLVFLFLWHLRKLKKLWGSRALRSPDSPTIEVNITRHARALAFLRLAEHTLVFTLGNAAVIILLRAIFYGSASELWQLPLAVLYGWAAFTSFRHSGAVNPPVWRTCLLVFSLLFVVAVGLMFLGGRGVLIYGQSSSSNLGQSDLLMGSVFLIQFSLVMATMTALGLGSVLVLLRSQVSGLGITASILINQLHAHGGNHIAPLTKIKRIDPVRGMTFAISAGVLIFGALLTLALSDAPLDAPLSPLERGMSAPLLVGYFMAQRAHRYFQVSADSLLSVDRRPPILFLRSFDDDEWQTAQSPDRSLLDYSLEIRLSNHFMKFGPFIAVGHPKEALPQLGAARALLPDDKWQERVGDWINEARLIVMYSGKTHWVNWELERIIQSGRVSRLILLIPEIKAWGIAKRYEELAQRAAQLRVVFRDTPWAGELNAWWDCFSLRAMVFRADGSLVAIRSASRSRDSYHFATLVAHYVLTLPNAVGGTSAGVTSGQSSPPTEANPESTPLAGGTTILLAISSQDDSLAARKAA